MTKKNTALSVAIATVAGVGVGSLVGTRQSVPTGGPRYKNADTNGDGEINMGDLLYVKACIEKPEPSCFGQVRISGRIVDEKGNGISGVRVEAR